MVAGYQQLEIYQLALKLAVDIHAMSLTLPRIETYEEGSQIRRSSKSIVANIVEGYGRRQYKNEFIKYVIYASASCDETKVHLEMLYQTGSLERERYASLHAQCLDLGKKLYRFRQSILAKHNQYVAEDASSYETSSADQHAASESNLSSDEPVLDPPQAISDSES